MGSGPKLKLTNRSSVAMVGAVMLGTAPNNSKINSSVWRMRFRQIARRAITRFGLQEMKQHYPGADVVDVDFEKFDQWLEWWGSNADSQGPLTNVEIVHHTRTSGVWEPITRRHFEAGDVSWDQASLRETGQAGGIGSRNRAVLYALHACLGEIDAHRIKIYGTEAITPMALLLRSLFPKFIGSEYATDPAVVHDLFPILAEDLTALSFPENAFDVVLTTEVLEHVWPLDRALSEIARVLRPGGWHVGTCPFACMDEKSIVKARIEDGRIVHLAEPEYHGDPMGTGGSLVFEIPGWDILSRAKEAGFSRAHWKFVRSRTFGIVSEFTGGIFVLCLQK